MITLNEKEVNALECIRVGYVNELDKLVKKSKEYHNLKIGLDYRFCGLDLFEESKIVKSELYIGNTLIEGDILTCIYDNALHKFRMVKRKANNGEYAYILNATDEDAFNRKYIGRCFKVCGQPIPDVDCVMVKSTDSGWCLYDDQYVVLEEI